MYVAENAVEKAERVLAAARAGLTSSMLQARSPLRSVDRYLAVLYSELVQRKPGQFRPPGHPCLGHCLQREFDEEFDSEEEDEELGDAAAVLPESTSDMLLKTLVRREALTVLCVSLHEHEYQLCLRAPCGRQGNCERLGYEERELLDALGRQQLPAELLDLLHEADCRLFFAGCVVCEVREFRRAVLGKQQSAEQYRSSYLLLRPSQCTLLADVRRLSEAHHLNAEQRVELESVLTRATAPPLCLDPSPAVSLIYSLAPRRCTPFADIVRSELPSAVTQVPLSPACGPLARMHTFLTQRKRRSSESECTAGGKRRASVSAGGVRGALVDRVPDVRAPDCSREDVLRVARRCVLPSEVSRDSTLRLREESAIEWERAGGRVMHMKLSVLVRPSDDSYHGQLLIDRDHAAASSSAASCQFRLCCRFASELYVRQCIDIFTEYGKKCAKLTHQVAGQPARVTYTRGARERRDCQQSGPAGSSQLAGRTTRPLLSSVTTGSASSAVSASSSVPRQLFTQGQTIQIRVSGQSNQLAQILQNQLNSIQLPVQSNVSQQTLMVSSCTSSSLTTTTCSPARTSSSLTTTCSPARTSSSSLHQLLSTPRSSVSTGGSLEKLISLPAASPARAPITTVSPSPSGGQSRAELQNPKLTELLNTPPALTRVSVVSPSPTAVSSHPASTPASSEDPGPDLLSAAMQLVQNSELLAELESLENILSTRPQAATVTPSAASVITPSAAPAITPTATPTATAKLEPLSPRVVHIAPQQGCRATTPPAATHGRLLIKSEPPPPNVNIMNLAGVTPSSVQNVQLSIPGLAAPISINVGAPAPHQQRVLLQPPTGGLQLLRSSPSVLTVSSHVVAAQRQAPGAATPLLLTAAPQAPAAVVIGSGAASIPSPVHHRPAAPQLLLSPPGAQRVIISGQSTVPLSLLQLPTPELQPAAQLPTTPTQRRTPQQTRKQSR